MSEQCRWCGNYHGARCPEVRAIEYHEDGSMKRVEFTMPSDRMPPRIEYSLPAPSPRDLSEEEKERIARDYIRRARA